MRAALLMAPGDIKMAEIPDVEPLAGQVLIRMTGLGLCGSDMGVFAGKTIPPVYPWIMGHEGVGIIVSVGEGVDKGRIGQQVAVEPNYFPLGPPGAELGIPGTCEGRNELPRPAGRASCRS